MTDVRAAVRTFIRDSFLLDHDAPLDDSASLLAEQVVDSTGFLELVNFIEATFGIAVADEEMIPDNLESVDNIVQFVARKST